MQRFSHASMELTVSDGEVHCSDGRKFDRVAYSRFKYGWLPPAIDYAHVLAATIAEQLWEVSEGSPIYIISAPYKYLPTASHAIARYLCQDLSVRAIQAGFEPPVLVPFHKAQVGDSSYAKSSHADRLTTLATLGLHIDESLVPGSTFLVVDDIRITGSAEIATATYLESLAPQTVWYLHVARLSEAIAQANPGLEDELNQTVEHNLEGILQENAFGEFELNTRVLRHILESESDDFQSFVRKAPTALLDTILQAAVGTGSAYCKKHAANLQPLNEELRQRGSLFCLPVTVNL